MQKDDFPLYNTNQKIGYNMTTGLTGKKWIVLEENNRLTLDLKKRYGHVIGQLIYNRRELFNNNLEEENIYPS